MRAGTGEPYSDQQRTVSGYSVTRMTYDLKDGAGTVTGYAEVNAMQTDRNPVVQGGAVAYRFASSASENGTFEDTSDARVDVQYYPNGTYSLTLGGSRPLAFGKRRVASCRRESDGTIECTDRDFQLGIQSCLPPGGISGTGSDPNQVHGSINEVKSKLDHGRTVTDTWNVTWNLVRQGTTR
jgi:hypothetical protein